MGRGFAGSGAGWGPAKLGSGLALLMLCVACRSGTVDGPADAGVGAARGDAGEVEGPVDLGPGFVDLTAALAEPPFLVPPPPTTQIPALTRGYFSDLDGDGRDEVLLAGFDAVTVYRLVDGALVRAPELDPPRFVGRGELRGVLDLDGDGKDELLWNPMRINWSRHPLQEDSSFFIGSLNAWDLDDDGWLDLSLGGSCCPGCAPQHPFLQERPGLVTPRPDLAATGISGATRALMSLPVDEGQFVVLVSMGCDPLTLPTGFLSGVVGVDGYTRLREVDAIDPDVGPQLRSVQDGTRVPFTLFSPMGAAAGDLDDDGRLDLVLALYHHQPLQALPDGRFRDRYVGSGLEAQSLPGRPDQPVTPWGVRALDVDLDGLLDLVFAHGHDYAQWEHPLVRGIRQRNALWLNQGDFRFSDATVAARVDRLGQYQTLTVGDPDRDGDADLVFGGLGELPRVMLNRVETGRHGFSLRLRGTSSNPLGLGARVVIRVDGMPDQHRAVALEAVPELLPAPITFASTGTGTVAREVEITWPTGRTQRLADVEAGRLHVVDEPPPFAIEPESRHAAPGTPVRLTVFAPEDAAVAVRVATGAATATAPAWDGSHWNVDVTQSTPGSATLSISLDGVPLRVRPRLWFDAP